MIKGLLSFLVDLFHSRQLILTMTIRDFQIRYLGSYLGLLWAFIQPAFTIMIFWFVFQIGFKSAPVKDFPFILWLICGMIPWFFISEVLATATNSIVENNFLVKKVVFRVSVLPIIKLLSALFIHIFFITIIFIFFALYGHFPSLYNLQFAYYSGAAAIFLLGITWLTSALTVFLKDINHLIAMLLQFGFWMTPIFWSLDILPQSYRLYIKLNPLYYIIEGYRDSFINNVWFWQHPLYTVYFWAITCLTLVAGAFVFSKLKPHFADVI